jgi:hypothetical protein
MRDIEASPEVAAIVGEEDLARLRTGAAFARYTCWACGRPGWADTQPASVVVELGEQAARVSLAHARCAPSHVVELRDVAVPAVAEDSDADMAAKAALFPYPGGSQAVLLLEPRVEIATRSPGGERIDVLLTGLLRMGLSLVHAVGELPGPAPGWQLELPGRRQVRVTAADGSVAYAGSCGQPRPWRQQIAVTGRCVVLTGTIGLYACPGRGDPAQLVDMVEAAARAGQLAGATITASRHA